VFLSAEVLSLGGLLYTVGIVFFKSIVVSQVLDSFLGEFAVRDVAKVPDSAPIPAF
jgi:hypothetical protein